MADGPALWSKSTGRWNTLPLLEPGTWRGSNALFPNDFGEDVLHMALCAYSWMLYFITVQHLSDYHRWLMSDWFIFCYFTATRSTSDWPDWPRVCCCSLWLSGEESSWGFDEEGWYPDASECHKQGSFTSHSVYCPMLHIKLLFLSCLMNEQQQQNPYYSLLLGQSG